MNSIVVNFLFAVVMLALLNGAVSDEEDYLYVPQFLDYKRETWRNKITRTPDRQHRGNIINNEGISNSEIPQRPAQKISFNPNNTSCTIDESGMHGNCANSTVNVNPQKRVSSGNELVGKENLPRYLAFDAVLVRGTLVIRLAESFFDQTDNEK